MYICMYTCTEHLLVIIIVEIYSGSWCFFYCLLCFFLFFDIQNVVTYSNSLTYIFHIRWSFLRLFVWLVMLSRNVIQVWYTVFMTQPALFIILYITVQFVGCAIINNIFHSIKGDGFCFIVSVFDIRCVRPTYYGEQLVSLSVYECICMYI